MKNILILGLALILAGCGLTGNVGVSGNSDTGVGVNGSVTNEHGTTVSGYYDPVTGQWSVAVGITFKEAPSATVVAALYDAGAMPAKNTALAWVFPAGVKPGDKKVMRAIGQAATVNGGYVLKPIQ